MNKTLPNPYYLFSFQHIASKERVSFYPQVITSNVRYDKFRFVEAPTTNLSATPPQVYFEYLGQYYYSIYENITSGSTDIALAYNKLESGRAWVIVGDDNTQECFFEPYISNDEDFAQVIYVSDQEEACIYPTPTNTPTPSNTPPPVIVNPSTLNALWWIDFTDVSRLSFGFGNQITQALDKISNVPFTAATPGAPSWTNLYEPSGSTLSNANPLRNGLGTYTTPFTEYTWFGRVYDDVVSQRGGKLLAASNGAAYPGGTPFLVLADFNLNPYPPGPVWNFQATTTTTNAVLDTNFTFSAWTDIAIRYYQSGSKVRFEFWENGIEISHTEITSSNTFQITNPVFGLMFDGGIDYNTEQFFFNRKLNNGEMAQMFSYLTNKY